MKPSTHSDAVNDATLRFLTSPPEHRLSRARRVVEAKFARGDYEMLQALDEATADGLARALIDEAAR